jgi:protein ImuB
MRRVASLYLPFLATDRIRRAQNGDAQPESPSAVAGAGPPRDPPPSASEAGLYLGADCSCPRGGGWRPGARWAENTKERRHRVEAEIAQLPLHQRPPARELGRRSEAADMPFKRIKPDKAGARTPAALADADIFVTTARSGQRITLAAVCRNALALGLTPGMPLTQARALVPGLDVREADPEADFALLNRIALFAARRITPLVAVSGSDGLWLDLSGVAHLHGGEQRLAHDLLRFCSKLELGARIAVAGNGAAAHAIARHGPDRLTICSLGGEKAALEPMPIAALRIEQDKVDALRRLGVERIGELVAMPRAPLARRFGKALLLRLDQALGQAAEPIDPIVPSDAPTAVIRFAEPIGAPDTIARAIEALLDQMLTRLREAGQGAQALLLLCDRVDRQQQRVEIGATRATRDKAHLLRLLARKVETIDPGFGIDAMRLIAARTEPMGATTYPNDLASAEAGPELAQLIDLIAGRIGTKRLYRFTMVESEVPERSVRRAAPLAEPSPWPDTWPRPPRLMPRPEPLQNVLAELPDAPPRRFTWRGRTHKLVKGDGPERIYGEWWKRNGERDSVRDYFRVEDEAGARFWVFRKGDGRDRATGDLSWWLQGGCG